MTARIRQLNRRGKVLVVLLGSLVLSGSLIGGLALAAGAAAKPAPPAPTIVSGPGAGSPTASTSATFTYSDSQSGVTFQCSLDGAGFSGCSSAGVTYSGLADGTHTFAVTAQAPGSAVSSATSRTWKVDTVKPPKPTMSRVPDNPTDNPGAHFSLADAESGVGYTCTLDAKPFAGCGPENQIDHLDPGDHCFTAAAVDAAGNVSDPASYCWAVAAKPTFTIRGTIAQPFAPGVSQQLDLALGNPTNSDITVTGVTVAVSQTTMKNGAPNPACSGTQNLVVVQQLSATPVVPGNTTKTLSQLGVPQSQWPLIQMPNLPTNQDACKNTSFSLSYTGSATRS
jgi:hypothetical protein